MKFKNLILYAFLFIGTLIASCGGDDDNDGDMDPEVNCATFSTDFQVLITDIQTAAQNFALDQSQVNCTAYLTSLDNYIDGVEDLLDCFPVADRDEVEAAIDEYRTERNAIGSDCSGS